jgi:hypothetical protein
MTNGIDDRLGHCFFETFYQYVRKRAKILGKHIEKPETERDSVKIQSKSTHI